MPPRSRWTRQRVAAGFESSGRSLRWSAVPAESVRVRVGLGYDGGGFSGWARQPGRRTVQGVLEEALGRVLRAEVGLTVAGRTDAGVHASGQVVHGDVPVESWDAVGPTLLRRLNGVLPPDVRVWAVAAAPDGFDARFSGLLRLDWARPGAPGERDRAAGGVLVATVEADAFCHSMVRSLVGALLAVGDGRRPSGWPASLLGLPGRAGGVTVAPAHGLTLVHVAYPPDGQLAARAAETRRRRAPNPG